MQTVLDGKIGSIERGGQMKKQIMLDLLIHLREKT